MKRSFLPLLFFFGFIFQLSAQDPFPCGAQAVGSDECPDACISCTNAQFLNVNTSSEIMTPSGTTTTWCSTIENDQYLGFIAGSSTVSITFTNTGCSTGSGLQGAIHGPQCSGTTQGCQTGIGVGASATITGTGLVVGEVYYLVIDGIAGSQCGLQITNASGVGAPSPNITNISGAVAVCPGREWEYTAISAGATRFNWRLQTKPAGSTITINDDPWPNAPAVVTTTDPTIRVTYSLPGTYTFCVQGENFCNRSTFRCITVVVTRPQRPAQIRNLCDNDIIPWCNTEPDFDASLYPAPSTQRLKCFFEEANGCIGEQDWTFNIARSPVLGAVDTVLCEGDSLVFQDDFGPVGPFNQAGNFDVRLERRRPRCDDNFQLFLNYIQIEPIIDPVLDINCLRSETFIDATRTRFSPSNATAVFTWSGPGIVSGQGTRRIRVNAIGTYTLTITVTLRYGVGLRKTKVCTRVVPIEVRGDLSVPTAVVTPKPNATIDCNNPSATLNVATLSPSHIITWTGPAVPAAQRNSPSITVSAAGWYVATVDNGFGCLAKDSTLVIDNSSIKPDGTVRLATPVSILSCDSSEVTLIGNTNFPGAQVSWSPTGSIVGGPPSPSTIPSVIRVNAPGIYLFTVLDPVTNCRSVFSVDVTENRAIPDVLASGGGIIDCSSGSIGISASSPIQNPIYSWSGPGGYTSSSASNNVSVPGTYVVTVRNPVNGCTNTDDVLVQQNLNIPEVRLGPFDELTCARTVTSIYGGVRAPTPAGYTFVWTGPGVVSSSSPFGDTARVNVAGLYSLRVTNVSNGCFKDTTLNVNLNNTAPVLLGMIPVYQIDCNQASIDLQANSPNNVRYEWAGPGIGAGQANVQNPNVTSPGTYTLTIVDRDNGCTASGSSVVNFDRDQPVFDIDSTLAFLNCDPSVSGTIRVFGQGGTYNYLWTGPGIVGPNNGPSITLNQLGRYNVVVTNPNNGCSSSQPVFARPDTISPNLVPGPNAIKACKDPSVPLSVSSSTPNVTFSWAGPGFTGTGASITAVNPGTYSVTATDPANRCTNVVTLTVTPDNSTPTINVTSNFPILDCRNVSAIFTASSSDPLSTYQWSNSSGIIPGETNPTLTVSNAGTYSVEVTGFNGCRSTESETIGSNTTPPLVNPRVAATITCASLSTTLGVDIVIQNPQYNWAGPDINAGNQSQTNPVVTIGGRYDVTVTDPTNGCSNTSFVTVLVQKQSPDATATVNNILTCSTTEVNLNGGSVTPNVTYVWTSPTGGIVAGTQGDRIARANAPGTYTVRVTNPANQCDSIATVTVVQDIEKPLISNPVTGQLDCQNTTLPISISVTSNSNFPPLNTFTYNWEGPGINGTNRSNPSPVVSEEGDYSVTVTGSNGCTEVLTGLRMSKDANIPSASPVISDTLTCRVTSVNLTLNPNKPGLTFTWSGAGVPAGQTNSPDLTGIQTPGPLQVVLFDPINNCRVTVTRDVQVDRVLPVTVASKSTDLNCNNLAAGVTISATSNIGNWTNPTYAWTGPNGYSDINRNPSGIVDAGVYEVILTNNNNGCASAPSTVNIAIDTISPTVRLVGDLITCAKPSVSILSTGSSAGPNFTYAWTGPSGAQTSTSYTGATLIGNYGLTIRNTTNGCSANRSITIAEDKAAPQALTATPASNVFSCATTSVLITATSSTAGVTYQWFDVNNTSLGTGPTFSATSAGTYRVRATGTNGCTSDATALITPDAGVPSADIFSPTITCANTSVVINNNPSKPTLTYRWSGPGGFTSTSEDPSVNVPGPYTVLLTDPSNGCTATAGLTVPEDRNIPVIDAGGIKEITCTVQQVALDGSVPQGNYTINWLTSPSTPSSVIVSGASSRNPVVSAPGYYVMNVINNANGCTNKDSVRVSATDIPVPIFDEKPIRCTDERNASITLRSVTGGAAPYTYSINGSAFNTVNTFRNLGPGTYNVILKDGNGCEVPRQFIFDNPERLTVELGTSQFITWGDSATLIAETNPGARIDQIVWTPSEIANGCTDCDEVTFKPNETWTYRVTIIDAGGCEAEDYTTVLVNIPRPIYIPNVFHPGSNLAENARFTIFGDVEFVDKVEELNIFNRWGEQVFSNSNFAINNLDAGWDGSFKGSLMQPATFVYYTKVKFKDGQVKVYQGDVTLLK
jgi:hypothetical protein